MLQSIAAAINLVIFYPLKLRIWDSIQFFFFRNTPRVPALSPVQNHQNINNVAISRCGTNILNDKTINF